MSLPTHLEEVLRQEVTWAAKLMWQKGYVIGTAGNISARLEDQNAILITQSGASYHDMTPEDVVLCALTGEKLSGAGKPSSEYPLHSAIYQARPDVNAIVHTHSIYATALAVARKEIPFFLDEMIYVVGPRSIPVASYAKSGSKALASHVVEILGRDGKAALMANHGTISVGRDIKTAFTISEHVEKAAMILILAKTYDRVVTLD